MYKIFRLQAFLLLAAFSFTACEKDGTELELTDGTFKANALSVSSADLVLAEASANDTVIRFNWSEADFGPTPVISYTLQLDLPADTTAANNWANAKNYSLGSKTGSYGFIGKVLNDLLNTMGLPPGTASPVVFRVKADVNQVGGGASIVKPVYSNTVVVNTTTYELKLYIPGEYQGWNPATAPLLLPIKGKAGYYDAYINITGGGTQYFKYTNAPDWDHTNYGDGGNGTFSTDGNAGGLNAPGPGYYEVTANLNNNTWTAVKTYWALIGDATPGGWDNETPMTYDAASQTWKVTLNMLQNGSFKFRANGNWALNFGINAQGKIMYADNPFLGTNPNPGLNNLTVPSDGNYTITLDLHESQNYTFILHKN